MRQLKSAFCLVTMFLLAACTPPDPKALLKVSDVETYWILDHSRTEQRLLAPAIRFRVENISQETLVAVDAKAAFSLEGAKDVWGSGSYRLTQARKRIAPGMNVLVTISSDARYVLEGAPQAAFTNKLFKPATATIFLKVGNSLEVNFGSTPVENVMGSKDARALLRQPTTE